MAGRGAVGRGAEGRVATGRRGADDGPAGVGREAKRGVDIFHKRSIGVRLGQEGIEHELFCVRVEGLDLSLGFVCQLFDNY